MVGLRGKIKSGDVGWVQLKLEDVVLRQKGAFVSGPFGSNISAKFFVDAGVPVIRGNNLTKGEQKFLDEGFVFLTDSKAAEFSNCIATEGDIIFTAAGSIGQVGIIPESKRYPYYIISNKQLRARIDPTKAKPLFVYYWLSSKKMVRWLESMNNGGAVPLLNLGIVRKAPIPCPPIKIQQRICDILSAYDDLIENNRRRIQLLEQAARLLYKEWFVHLRFPGHEHVAITNGVPDGWKKEKVCAHVDFVRGVEPGSKNYMQVSDEGLVPFLRVGDFGNRLSNIFIDATFAEGNMLKPQDVAITMDGTPGLVGFGMTGAFSSGIRKVVPKDNCGIGWSFIYTLLKSESIQATVARFAKGTTILHASSSIDHMVFLQSHQGILDVFEDVAGSLLRQVLLLEQQNRKLVKARDLLLPRLMSGAVTV